MGTLQLKWCEKMPVLNATLSNIVGQLVVVGILQLCTVTTSPLMTIKGISNSRGAAIIQSKLSSVSAIVSSSS